jgi:hypothetical protein
MKAMCENDISVTFTEAEHEMILDVLRYSLESFDFTSPYSVALNEIPMENEIVQRRFMIENLRDRFQELWVARF